MPVLEAIEAEVEIIEDRVLARPMTAADIERLYMPRRRRAAFIRYERRSFPGERLNQARASS